MVSAFFPASATFDRSLTYVNICWSVGAAPNIAST
jgi:hypothetical protein